MTKLTRKQSRFVAEYLVDLNAAQAAIRAGYSARTARQMGQENLSKPDIQAAIDEAMGQRQNRTQMTADRVLLELSRIALFDARKLLHADGTPRAIQDLDDDTAAAVAGLEVMEVWEGTGADRAIKGVVKKYRISDKNAALANAMRHHGLLGDRLIGGREVVPANPSQPLAQRGQALLDAAAAGVLTVPQAAQLLAGLGTLAKLVETDELSRRLDELEKHHSKGNGK